MTFGYARRRARAVRDFHRVKLLIAGSRKRDLSYGFSRNSALYGESTTYGERVSGSRNHPKGGRALRIVSPVVRRLPGDLRAGLDAGVDNVYSDVVVATTPL